MADASGATHVTDPASQADPAGAAEIQRLVDRSGDLKQDLVAFAGGRRFDRYREPELRKAAEDGTPPPPGSERWVQAMDDFIMTFRFPDGDGVIDRYLSGPDGKNLRKADRKLLESWREPVDGIFELRDKGSDQILLFNLIDELEYRTYASAGFARLTAEPGSFVLARLAQLKPGAWVLSGSLSQFPREHAKVVAQLALEWVQTRPRLAFRNPEKRERGWEMMREDRDEFAEFFGSDQVVIPADEALRKINDYYRDHQEKALAKSGKQAADAPVDRPYFTLPEGALAGLETVGVVYDETDGMSLLPDFGLLEELFADPSLAGDKRYADVLNAYLKSDSIYPGPLRRLAAAHPDTVDEVYRAVLKKPAFTWEKNGELLLSKRKPWYFQETRYPKSTPVSDYLVDLIAAES
jgi:hypothetical protein